MEDTTTYEETRPTPDLDALEQEETDVPLIPVDVPNAVRVYRLPPRRSVMSTDTVNDTAFTAIAAGNGKRNRLVLVSIEQPIWISRDGRTQGSIWPAGVPYTVEHCDGVFVKSATAGQTTRVGATAELWAD